MKDLRLDIFIVNEDGHTPDKEQICSDSGIEYKVLKRIHHANLPVRSTTSLRKETPIPYIIDLDGTWIDQLFVSKYYHGLAIMELIGNKKAILLGLNARKIALERHNKDRILNDLIKAYKNFN
jgi:hypothetical protein